MNYTLERFSEALLETDIYCGHLSEDKLTPLFNWNANIKDQVLGTLTGMKQSLIAGRRDFKTTPVENLPEHLQQSLAKRCKIYVNQYKDIQKKENNEELDGGYDDNVQDYLDNFLKAINEIIYEVISIHSNLENKRIHDIVYLLMQYYLDYLRDHTKIIAPEWNLSINNAVLDNLHTPKINPTSLKVEVGNGNKKEHHGFLWLRTRYINYKTLPAPLDLHKKMAEEFIKQLDALLIPFQEMFEQYFVGLSDNVLKEQERVLQDFEHKLTLARQQRHEDYEKVKARWQPLFEQSKQLDDLVNQFVHDWNLL